MRDRCKLAGDTLHFHLGNGLQRKGHGPDCTSQQYRIRYGGRVMDIHLRRHGGDIFVFHEVFGGDVYRPQQQIGANVRTVVDLGANIGLTTLYFQKYFPNAAYFCVEPNPANAAILRRNVTWMGNRTRIVQAAISDQTGYATFDSDAPSYGGRLTADGTGTAVRCETLLSVLDQFGIDCVDILKVDIEGAEKQLFRSAAVWLPRVKSIVIEIHNNSREAYDVDVDRYRAYIESQGFTLLLQSERCPMLWACRDERK